MVLNDSMAPHTSHDVGEITSEQKASAVRATERLSLLALDSMAGSDGPRGAKDANLLQGSLIKSDALFQPSAQLSAMRLSNWQYPGINILESERNDAQRAYAAKYTEIPIVRERLRAMGIDPDKVNVGIGIVETDRFSQHASNVSSILADRTTGVIHNARIDVANVVRGDQSQVAPNASIRDAISDALVESLDSASDSIKALSIDKTGPQYRVLNFSNGVSKEACVQQSIEVLASTPGGRAIVEGLIGKDKTDMMFDTHTTKSQFRAVIGDLHQALMRVVDQQFTTDPRVVAAMDRYRKTTAEAANKGTMIVVAAGNDGRPRSDGPSDAALNMLAMSDYVISVGASNDSGTPGDRSDDSIADFSSCGNSRWHPTVVVPGQSLPITGSPDVFNDGTSFATPQVTGIVALMLEQNPKLTFPKVKQILEQNTTRLANSLECQGSGALNMELAVAAAKRSR
jgi:hypothetical protein